MKTQRKEKKKLNKRDQLFPSFLLLLLGFGLTGSGMAHLLLLSSPLSISLCFFAWLQGFLVVHGNTNLTHSSFTPINRDLYHSRWRQLSFSFPYSIFYCVPIFLHFPCVFFAWINLAPLGCAELEVTDSLIFLWILKWVFCIFLSFLVFFVEGIRADTDWLYGWLFRNCRELNAWILFWLFTNNSYLWFIWCQLVMNFSVYFTLKTSYICI